MPKLNIRDIDLDSRDLSFPQKQKIKKRKNKKEGDIKNIVKGKQRKQPYIFIYTMGKKEKYGNYICKVGYLDIRQKIEMPRFRKLNNGEKQKIPGKVEVFVYHAKNKLAGPYKGKEAAVVKAKELVSNNIRYEKHPKN